jgi:hypothetical protein
VISIEVGRPYLGRYETRRIVAIDNYFGYVKYETLNNQGDVMYSRGQRDVTKDAFAQWLDEEGVQ